MAPGWKAEYRRPVFIEEKLAEDSVLGFLFAADSGAYGPKLYDNPQYIVKTIDLKAHMDFAGSGESTGGERTHEALKALKEEIERSNRVMTAAAETIRELKAQLNEGAVWSEEPPTEAGFYWWKKLPFHGPSLIEARQLSPGINGLSFYAANAMWGGYSYEGARDCLGGEWQPVQPPKISLPPTPQ